MAPALCLSSCLMSLRLLLDQSAKVLCFPGDDTSEPGPLSQLLGEAKQVIFLLMDLFQLLHTNSPTALPGEDTLLPHLSHMFSGKGYMSSCSFSMSSVGQK